MSAAFSERIRRFIPWLRLLGAVASGLLLAAAYPPWEIEALAWIALAPLGAAVRGLDVRAAARLGFISGAIYWMATLHFLTPVTVLGYLLLALYCALFFIPPAVFAARWTALHATPDWNAHLGFLLGWTAVWTAADWVRGWLFTGFPWNPLGVSLYRNTVLIQSAAWGGVWSVSALVAWVNAAAIATVYRYLARPRGASWRTAHPEILLAFLAVAGAFLHGYRTISALPPPTDGIRVALIQPAVPQYEKWDDAFVAGIYERLRLLTETAHRAGPPELVVWPETSVPDNLRTSETAAALVRDLTVGGIPLLVGALDGYLDDAGRPHFFNSAFLIRDGALSESYDKQHLVLFGEYIPFSNTFPFLRRLTPVEFDVEPGRKPVVFRGPRPDAPFAALICFEDVFPYLGRRFARAGARWFVNQTNDAWYEPFAGSRQHLANAVFRCVETRRPLARSANTGVTGWIDAAGRIRAHLPTRTPDGALASGFLSERIELPPAATPETFYVRRGDVFAASASVVAIVFLGAALRTRRRG